MLALASTSLASPVLLYVGCALGVLGLGLALPRRGLSPQVIGALVAGAGLGAIFIALGVANPEHLPNYNFYIFGAIALGASLRVISHPRPVYAALYFILTILASCGLYVLLSAEFMAFALVIVYAGAILITYLFVIMLATETPTADAVEALSDYDRYSREPAFAAVIGLLLLAGLTTLFGRGVSTLSPATTYAGAERIEWMPRRVEKELRNAGLMQGDEQIARSDPSVSAGETQTTSGLLMNFTPIADGAGGGVGGVKGEVTIAYGDGQLRTVTSDDPRWPESLKVSNPEGVGFTLLADHPGGIEVAGVILLMAMLGAVVLARKKIEADEAAKRNAMAQAGAPGVSLVGGAA